MEDPTPRAGILGLASRLGLRTRIIVLFGLGALLLSTLLSVITYSLVRSQTLTQRESVTVERAFRNTRFLPTGQPGDEGYSPALLLNNIPTAARSGLLLYDGQAWGESADQFATADDLPVALVEAVDGGEASRMRLVIDGTPYLAVGVPVPERNFAYYEVTPLDDIGDTLRLLLFGLLGAGTVTTIVGVGFGYWAGARVLHPLREVSSAAEAISGGQLDTRLPDNFDTDLQPLVGSFNGMVDSLSYRIERDARFASEVSHELRSPLMTLSASSAVLQARREDMPERAQQALDLLVDDVARFSQLVDDLLEISRFDVGAQHLALDRVNVAELVMQTVDMCAENDVLIEVDAAVSDFDVRVDKRRIYRVLDNLIDNARKYGGGTEKVLVFSGGNETVCIAVEDGGDGVVEAERRQIFDRFSRGKAAGQRGAENGVGLGLALVTEHISLHGGRVWCEERPDGEDGARFVVELPVHTGGQVDEAEEFLDEGDLAVVGAGAGDA